MLYYLLLVLFCDSIFNYIFFTILLNAGMFKMSYNRLIALFIVVWDGLVFYMFSLCNMFQCILIWNFIYNIVSFDSSSSSNLYYTWEHRASINSRRATLYACLLSAWWIQLHFLPSFEISSTSKALHYSEVILMVLDALNDRTPYLTSLKHLVDTEC